MTNLIIGLLIGGIAAWYLGVKYAHVMISLECERLGGFFFGSKVYKCVAVFEQQAESGVPDVILEAHKGIFSGFGDAKIDAKISTDALYLKSSSSNGIYKISGATKETCHHFSTTFFADGKATCFGCGAIINGRREVLGASKYMILGGEK